jgi:hypothetical protein
MTIEKKKSFRESVVLTGQVKFSNLKEPKGIPGLNTAPKYSLVLSIPEGDKQIEHLKSLHSRAVHFETALLPAGKKPKIDELNISEDSDTKDGPHNGKMRLNLSRKENFGAPDVFYPDLTEYDKDFINQGSEVQVSAVARSYKLPNNTIGMTFQLEAVQILSEVLRKPKTASDYGFKPIEGISGSNTDEELY